MKRDDMLREGRRHEFKWTPTNDRAEQLHMDAHYTDERFRKEQVVFGNPDNGLQWEYDDRLRQWDYEGHAAAWNNAKNTVPYCPPRSASFYEAYLSAYYKCKIDLRCIIVGVNRGNGYPYAIFGFISHKEAQS